MEILKEPNECAFDLNKNGKTECFDDHFFKELTNFAKNVKQIITSPKDTLKELKKIYNCTYDSCLLVQGEISDTIGYDKTKKQLERFKPSGPYSGEQWFSNTNIDSVLEQIEKKYKQQKFKHIPFQMRDFESTGGELSKIDWVQEYKDGIRCFGVVFNTDTSAGSGKHWYSIYGDLTKEPFTIEYFNSSGEEPQDEIRMWMKKTKHNLEKGLNKKVNDVVVTKIQHQKDNHSCGSYSIYYILSRLEGVPHMVFSKKIIPDELMHKFRFSLFRKEQ